jgi:LPXTG-motif cell wall-anchored protein
VRGTGVVEEIYGTGFAAGESVSGTVHSTPIALEAKTADAQGRVTWQVPIDAVFELGDHTVDLVGATSGPVAAGQNNALFTVLDKPVAGTTGTSTGSTATTGSSTTTGAASGAKGNSLPNTGLAMDWGVPVLSALLLAAGAVLMITRRPGGWARGTRPTDRR